MLNPARARLLRGERTGGRTGKNEEGKEGYRFEGLRRAREGTTYQVIIGLVAEVLNTGRIRGMSMFDAPKSLQVNILP
jgi:hypothetical protein